MSIHRISGDKEGKAASKGNVIKQVYRWAPAEFNSPEELCKPIQNACLKVIAPARKETGPRWGTQVRLAWEPSSVGLAGLLINQVSGAKEEGREVGTSPEAPPRLVFKPT